MKKINIKNNKNELFLNLIIQKNNERNTKRFFTKFGVFLIACLFASIITIFADSNPDANDDENDNIRECQIEMTLPSALPASDGVAFKDEKKYTVEIAKFKCTKCNKEGIATPSKNEVGGGMKHYIGDIFWTATCRSDGKSDPVGSITMSIKDFLSKTNLPIGGDITLNIPMIVSSPKAISQKTFFPIKYKMQDASSEEKSDVKVSATVMFRSSNDATNGENNNHDYGAFLFDQEHKATWTDTPSKQDKDFK